MRLPIDPLLPEIVASLTAKPSLVLEASPGAGKTTRVPPAILAAPFVGNKKVIVLEPRRLAAKLSARRVAEERGEKVGETVGYQFRQETVIGPKTRLVFLTEGMLMRRLLSDPRLGDTACVILDEFHERHLHGDAALASLLRLQREQRGDLRLVVMSATLEGTRLAELLDCPVLRSEVRQHPVDIRYAAEPSDRHLELRVRDAVRGVMSEPGDCLVFLPGLADIRRAETALQGQKEFRVFPLYADLSREEQDAALKPGAQRRVILSTNVAETSLTIEGITSVVDSGLHRQASYSWWSGIPALKTRPVSKASAIQRAGRAGRLGPGRCVRLYTKGDFEGRASFDTPEILRADLAQLVLEVAAMGVADPGKMPWLDPPPESSLEAARSLLTLLGAIVDGRITPLGKKLAGIPAHPRLARMLVAADEGGVLNEAATLAALLSDAKLEGIDALEATRGRFDEGTRRTRELLLRGFSHPKSGSRDALAKSVLAGFPDRIARVRGGDLVLSSGGSAGIDPHEWDTPLFVALDLQEQKHARQARAVLRVRSVVPIQESWLFDLEPSPLVDKDEVIWDAKRGRVQGVSRLCCGQLVLAESETDVKDEAAAARLLIKEGLGTPPDTMEKLDVHDWLRVLGKVTDAEALETDLARLEIIRGERLTGKAIADGVVKALEGQRTLREVDWGTAVLGDARHHINRLAPTSITLPSGRSTRIRYALGKQPWVESRLQDFFGMKKTPRILDGKVALTLHLLAPNQRAVQVTSDLESFWKSAYAEVRKELSRRYPRHKWPENPF